MRKFETIRTDIKELSIEQKTLKPQRKGDNSVAAFQVWKNKRELRHLFQAYAILKGIERPVIKKEDKFVDEKTVLNLVEKYSK